MFLNEYAVVLGKTNVSICIYGQNYVESGRRMAGDGKCAKQMWREMWSAPKMLYRSWCQHDVLAINQRQNNAMTDILRSNPLRRNRIFLRRNRSTDHSGSKYP